MRGLHFARFQPFAAPHSENCGFHSFPVGHCFNNADGGLKLFIAAVDNYDKLF